MTPLELGFGALAALLVLIVLRFPIGLALLMVSMVGIGELKGWSVAAGMLQTEPFDFAAHWSFSAIPMFLLMGAVAHHSGISAALFRAGRVWLGGLPGGLAVAANFACAGFSAASGSSIATAAAMGRITIPEMTRYGYDKGLATGVVASAGTLGAMIPPSIGFVLYGIFAEVSISKLFIAGILPGLMTALVYAAMIIVRCKLRPELAPPFEDTVTWGERWRALAEVWPIGVLVFCIIGGLYLGIVTPTEAGAAGAFVALVIAVIQRRMTYQVLKESVLEGLGSTARVFFVAVGAVILVPLAFAAEAPLSLNPSTGAIGAILVTGVFCTAIAMSLYFVVVRRVGATRSSIVLLFFPVVAVALGAAVLGERLPVEAFVGLALIMAGALAVGGGATARPPGPAAAAPASSSARAEKV